MSKRTFAFPRARPRLEALEGRAVPAVINIPLVTNERPDHVLVRPMGANVDVVVNGALRYRGPDRPDLVVSVNGSGDADSLTVHTGLRASVAFSGGHGADALTPQRGDGRLGIVSARHTIRSSSQAVTLTGRRLIALKKFERSRDGSPASSIR